MDVAYRAMLRHISECSPCRADGINCADANALKATYRAAKTAALGAMT
ncbi:hypothetical protein ACWEAF_35875 [Streptomyces sp. NPDC005071]